MSSSAHEKAPLVLTVSSSSEPRPSAGVSLPLLAGLLFGSGFCALICQVAWQREFRLIFGASTAASAAVLAIFMGGLGAGSLYFGARADRHPRPLLLYAELEGAIAVFAALTPSLLRLGRLLYVGAGGTTSLGQLGGTMARLAIASLVVLPITFLMEEPSRPPARRPKSRPTPSEGDWPWSMDSTRSVPSSVDSPPRSC